MQKKNGKRTKKFEVYVDDGDDLDVARRKVYKVMKDMDPAKERIVLVVMTEPMYPEEETNA